MRMTIRYDSGNHYDVSFDLDKVMHRTTLQGYASLHLKQDSSDFVNGVLFFKNESEVDEVIKHLLEIRAGLQHATSQRMQNKIDKLEKRVNALKGG